MYHDSYHFARFLLIYSPSMQSKLFYFLHKTTTSNLKASPAIKTLNFQHFCSKKQTQDTQAEVHFGTRLQFCPYRPDLFLVLLKDPFHTHTAAAVHLSICQTRFRRQSETRHGWMELRSSQGCSVLRPLGHRGDSNCSSSWLFVCECVREWMGCWERGKSKVSKATEACQKVRGERNNQVRQKRWSKRGSGKIVWWRCLRKTSHSCF